MGKFPNFQRIYIDSDGAGRSSSVAGFAHGDDDDDNDDGYEDDDDAAPAIISG